MACRGVLWTVVYPHGLKQIAPEERVLTQAPHPRTRHGWHAPDAHPIKPYRSGREWGEVA